MYPPVYSLMNIDTDEISLCKNQYKFVIFNSIISD